MSVTAPHAPKAPKVDKETQQAIDQTAGYLTLKEVTLRDVNGDSSLHHKDVVLSAWEVEPYVKMRVAEGSHRYRSILEPLTSSQVAERRERATSLEGDRVVDGNAVSAPWPDYIGLHPEEVIDRLRQTSDRGLIERVRLYERGGLKRQPILDYTPPAEREPWVGYDDYNVNEVLEKLPLMGPQAVQDVMSYESCHRKRPAILTYEPESEPASPSLASAISEAASEETV